MYVCMLPLPELANVVQTKQQTGNKRKTKQRKEKERKKKQQQAGLL